MFQNKKVNLSMRTLTINIDDSKSEKAIIDFLDNMGLDYSVDLTEKTYSWWADQEVINKLNNRSENLKSGVDNGLSFTDIKNKLLNK
ncbi:hypothetical protein H7U22_04635 [Pedobacter sp. CCM 8938]|uniref:Uncharacterized protein n=1 Tax=Pedobacter fastidiosus TaxID=2765361 RepID=A0ABR7KPN8_9SPHI|nr:hypothetical protein [Pedobacter fastidiosus]MBC6109702.1 hypothetical protein [Pedobacter fastidiosus]